MARIPYAREDEFTPAIHEQLSDRPSLNLYRMLPRLGEPAALGFLALGRAFLREGALDPCLRELAVLRTGHLCGAHYEVHQHERVARRVGTADEKIAALAAAGPNSLSADQLANVFTDVERAVLTYTEEVVNNVKATDESFEVVRSHLGDRLTGELTMLIGFYGMVSRLLENLEIDLEDPHDVV